MTAVENTFETRVRAAGPASVAKRQGNGVSGIAVAVVRTGWRISDRIGDSPLPRSRGAPPYFQMWKY